MPEEKPKDESLKEDSQWQGFKEYVKKIAQVPKEELDERLAERERKKKEKKRAG